MCKIGKIVFGRIGPGTFEPDSSTLLPPTSGDHGFVVHLLTVVFPELRLIYFPLGTMILLPGRQSRVAR
jgi:hypothetical protein